MGERDANKPQRPEDTWRPGLPEENTSVFSLFTPENLYMLRSYGHHLVFWHQEQAGIPQQKQVTSVWSGG